MERQLIYTNEFRNIRTKSLKIVFTLKYNTDKLVYFESFSIAGDAFKREKQIKTGSRKKKIDLIIAMNPEWKDLFEILKGNQGEELIRIKRGLLSPSKRLC